VPKLSPNASFSTNESNLSLMAFSLLGWSQTYSILLVEAWADGKRNVLLSDPTQRHLRGADVVSGRDTHQPRLREVDVACQITPHARA
jgi:hypothetical protein